MLNLVEIMVARIRPDENAIYSTFSIRATKFKNRILYLFSLFSLFSLWFDLSLLLTVKD